MDVRLVRLIETESAVDCFRETAWEGLKRGEDSGEKLERRSRLSSGIVQREKTCGSGLAAIFNDIKIVEGLGRD